MTPEKIAAFETRLNAEKDPVKRAEIFKEIEAVALAAPSVPAGLKTVADYEKALLATKDPFLRDAIAQKFEKALKAGEVEGL